MPFDVVARANGVLVVSDRLNRSLRAVNLANGVVSTIVGGPKAAAAAAPGQMFADGDRRSALLYDPTALLMKRDGVVLVCDGHCIRALNNGCLETIAGSWDTPGRADGEARTALFCNPGGLIELKDGTVLVADSGNELLRALSPDGGTVSTLAGSGERGGLNGRALQAQMSGPKALALCEDGSVLVAESVGNRVRRLFTPSMDAKVSATYREAQRPISEAASQLQRHVREARGTLLSARETVASCLQEV